MNILINPEFKALIPPLSPEEYDQLEKNIIADGCRESLVVFNGVLIDGHNRYEICTKHDLPFSIIEKDFADIFAAKLWMIRNQFGRRNLPKYQRSVLALRLEPYVEEKARANQRCGQGGVLLSQKSAEANPIETRKEIAKQAGVSHNTIDKVKKILAVADEETKQKLSAGDPCLSINKVYADIKKEERNAEQKIKEADSANQNIKPGWIITDSQEIVACDAVITDPPYGILDEDWDRIELEKFTREWLSGWNLCGADIFVVSWSERHLYEACEWFDDELSNYDFQQTLIWHYPNNKKPSSKLKFKHTFEPVFFYRKKGSTKKISVGGGEWGAEINSFDCLVCATPQSNFKDENMKQHPAQKPLEVMRWLVNAATLAGEMVADPFSGSGATGIAAMQLGRSFHGIEINPDFIVLASNRIVTYG